MNDPGFTQAVEFILRIQDDLDEFDTPKEKLPNCPKCDDDELGVIHADLILCYACRWKLEGKVGR